MKSKKKRRIFKQTNILSWIHIIAGEGEVANKSLIVILVQLMERNNKLTFKIHIPHLILLRVSMLEQALIEGMLLTVWYADKTEILKLSYKSYNFLPSHDIFQPISIWISTKLYFYVLWLFKRFCWFKQNQIDKVLSCCIIILYNKVSHHSRGRP